MRFASPFLALAVLCAAIAGCVTNENQPAHVRWNDPTQWRAEHRIIDLHQHINGTTQHLARAVRIMDRVGIGVAVNLSGGYVTRNTSAISEFERTKQLTDTLFPGRFVHYMNLNYAGWDAPDFSAKAVQQVEEGHRLGAAGFKEFKRLGLYLRDASGQLIKIDDPKLDPVWKRCGELGMPVSIHVADPRAFWRPYNETNERWKELKDHRSWWFGDTNKYPARMELLEALNRVIARHPETTFVCVHFANNAEELEWVDAALDRYPNMMADLAARIPELGRHDPEKVRRLFIKHQDRILFATDFQVSDRLILGSSGNEPPPTDDDAAEFFAKEWRWLETNDRNFPHMTPIQGDWTISGVGLPPAVLRKIYFENARRLLARALPPPSIRATRITRDFSLDGDTAKRAWQAAEPIVLQHESRSGKARRSLGTTVRALWSDQFLYLAYDSPFTDLTIFEPVQPKERMGLWERDVVEAFMGADFTNINRYTEYEVAPTNERLDVRINKPNYDFDWDSGFESATRVDRAGKRWTAEMRIPLRAVTQRAPQQGEAWRINFYRCDYANKAFLAWSPTGDGSFHVPARFGSLHFD